MHLATRPRSLLCRGAVKEDGGYSKPRAKRRGRSRGLRLQRGLVDRSTRGIEIADTVEQLQLQDHTSTFYFQGCKDEMVTVILDTERCSGGSFLKGDVSVNLQFQCVRCASLFEHPIRSSFSLWANRKIKSWDECIDIAELPFPPSAGHLDITQSVAMAIEEGFPRLQVCGQSSCVSSAVSGVGGTDRSGWSTSPEPPSNPFSSLKDFRETLKNKS